MLRSRIRTFHGTLAIFALHAWLHSAAVGTGATVGSAIRVGMISASALDEVSGIVDARAHANVFWVHNDSGDPARFFAINIQGALLGTHTLTGASAQDWEDMAIGPKSGGGNYLYLADIGDNAPFDRASVRVYRTTEPASTATASIAAANYATAILQYPSGARNAEAFLVDPLTNELLIITKSATTEIYSAPASAFGAAATTLTSRGLLGGSLSTVTAADISPDGRHILIRGYSAARLYERAEGQTVADALHAAGVAFALGAKAQGEAIGWAADGTNFYTTSEYAGGASAPIYRYSYGAPQRGDFNDDGAIDALDLTTWKTHFAAGAGGDADEDHDTDGRDFLVWQRNFSGPNPLALAVVPEPASSCLLVLATLGLAMARAFHPSSIISIRR